MFTTLIKYLKISRLLNVSIAFLSLWVAGLISPKFTVNGHIILASFTVAFITAGANIINDIYDLDIDRINKPKRLLPGGVLTIKTAYFYFGFSYAAGLLLALLNGWTYLIIALLIALLLYFYSFRLKRTVLWGNGAVSFSAAMVFIYGAFAVGDWPSGIIPALFAFFFHFGREALKDLQDLKGDLANEAVTFPAKYGFKKSVLLINFLFMLLLILTLLPYIFSIYNRFYLYIVIIGVDCVLTCAGILLWVRQEEKILGLLSHLLKLDMFVGLAAIFIGSRNVVFFN